MEDGLVIRDNYEDICRIWMPPEAVNWYSFIATAAEELLSELHLMDRAKSTPEMFGLSVRSHPASLLLPLETSWDPVCYQPLLVLSNKFIKHLGQYKDC